MQTVQACAERTAFHSHMLKLFERYDALALPTAQVWPFPAEWRWPQTIGGRAMDTYHRWMEVVIYATLRRVAVHRDAGGIRRERPADGQCS